jgi:Asp/Glu/hydantoin racemase
MNPKLALVHTGIGVVESIVAVVKELSPDTEIINIVDDTIVKTIAAHDNVIPPVVFRRMTTYFVNAEEAGADAALLTCSSISESVDVAQPFVKIPLFKIDEPMADKAVGMADRIGVVATLRTTLEPTKRLILARAEKRGKRISLHERLCKGAFEAWQRGDGATHDQIVKEAVTELLAECPVVVLAQASMARAAQSLGSVQDRVLASMRLGVARAVEYLRGRA